MPIMVPPCFYSHVVRATHVPLVQMPDTDIASASVPICQPCLLWVCWLASQLALFYSTLTHSVIHSPCLLLFPIKEQLPYTLTL